MPYVQVPLDHSLLDSNKRFFVRYVETELNPFKDKIDLESSTKIPGFEKAELFEKADFIFLIEEVSNSVKNYKASKNKKTSKEGKVSYTYITEGDLVNVFRIKLIDKNKDSLMFSSTSSSTIKISSNVCSSSDQAKSKYKELLNKKRKENRKKGFINTVNGITNNYSYLNKTLFLNFAGVKFKKYDYSEINAIAEESLNVISKLNSVETDTKVNGYIKVWNKELENFVEGDKKARVNEKVKAGLLFNLSLAYFYLNDLEKAKSFLDECVKYKYVVANRQGELYNAIVRNINHAKK